MIKNKKQMFIILGSFLLVLILFTTTYAFFNYTRTGTSNTIKVGRISFVTRQTSTINLVNVFPIDSEDVDTDTDNVDEVVIGIEGDTDYVDGIEYLVSSVDSSVYTSSGVLVPISLDITVDGLGTENANYFTARDSKNANIYKKLVGGTLVGDQMLLVGYIKKNTTNGVAEGVDGSITIKAYFDKDKILISDTYDGTESDNMGTTNNQAAGKTVITTNEWNSLQSSGVSFKIKVEANEGIWVTGSLEEIMKVKNLNSNNQPVRDDVQSTYVTGENGINFGEVSSDTNGKGVYLMASTQNDDYPIYYYRGAVEDNNVLFNNKCWKAVRTTDTGGVKLIYSGELGNVYEKVSLSENQYTIVTNTDGTNINVWTFDPVDNSWNALYTTGTLELSFKVPASDGYTFEMTGQNGASGSGSYILYKGTNSVTGGGGGSGEVLNLNYSFGSLTANDVVKFTFAGAGFTTPSTFKVKMIPPDSLITTSGCGNMESNTQISLNSTNAFPFSGSGLYKSPAYNGYMRGINVYEYKLKNSGDTFKFGAEFIYDNGRYTLIGAENGISNTRHYTCFTSSETCDGENLGKIYYVYYKSGNNYYYIELENGKSANDALTEMQQNEVDSNAKDKIDTWYLDNMIGATNKLEDTIWCNDRSFGDGNNNGWISNGGDYSLDLHYAARERGALAANTSTVKNQPSLVCVNKNDAFTVKNNEGNKALTYPIALLTADEIVLAGGVYGQQNETFYLNSDTLYWSLSPSDFFRTFGHEISMYGGSGVLSEMHEANSLGLRPAISIKPGLPVVSGSGTPADPYVIE